LMAAAMLKLAFLYPVLPVSAASIQ
jgi:hypothetical protein